MKFQRNPGVTSTRAKAALALAGLLVVASCGGGDSESSSRQRNSALAACASTTLGEPTLSNSPGGGYDVVVTVELCEGATSFSTIGTDGQESPVQVGDDRKGVITALGFAGESRDYPIRLFNGGTAIGDEVISLSIRENNAVCNLGGPCKAGDVGPGGGVIVDNGDTSKAFLEVPKLTSVEAAKFVKFPTCTTTETEPWKPLTPGGYRDGKEATTMMESLCSESNELFAALADFNAARAVRDWFIPSIDELVIALDNCCDKSFPDKEPFATSTLISALNDNGQTILVNARGAYWPRSPSPIQPGRDVHFLPVRYAERKSAVQAEVVVTPANASTDNGDSTATPEPGTTLADTSEGPAREKCGGIPAEELGIQTLPSAENLDVSYDEASTRGTLRINFEYPTASWDSIDKVGVEVYGASRAPGVDIDASLGSAFVNTSTITSTESGTGRTLSVTNSRWAVSKAQLRVCVRLIRDRDGDSGRATSDIVSTVVTVPELPPVLVLSDDALPRTPKNFAVTVDDQGMLRASWSPDRPAVNESYAFSAASYPYRYKVFNRLTPTDGGDTPWTRAFVADDSSYTTGSLIFREGVSYDFFLEEFYDPDANGYGEVSPASDVVSLVPNPGGGNQIEQEGQLNNDEVVSKLKDCEKIPADIRFSNADDIGITSASTDDGVFISVKHVCVKDLPILGNVTLVEKDPQTGAELWQMGTIVDSESTAMHIWFPAFSAGSHKFVAQVVWDFDGETYRTPFSRTNFEVTQGTRVLPAQCTPDKVTFDKNVLSVNCEGVVYVAASVDVPNKANRDFGGDGDKIELSKLPAGWLKAWVDVLQWSSNYSERFTMLLCAQQCDAPTPDKQFTVAINGDTVTASVTQNECDGDPDSELEEFFKVTDNVYYSFNRYFRVSEQEVPSNGKSTSFKLQPATAALLTERSDYCDVLAGRRVYSLVTINRVPAALPDPSTAPRTEEKVTELSRNDVGETGTVVVPAGATTLTVSRDAFQQLVNSLGGDVIGLGVSVDSGPWHTLAVGESNDVKISKGAKQLVFRGTKSDGSTVELTKLVDFNDEKTVDVEPSAASSNDASTQGTEVTATTIDGSSGMSPILLILAAVAVLLVVALVVTSRRKKPTE